MSQAFHEIRFPFSLTLGARGGPVRRTEIVSLVSGHEERNAPWAQSRRRWNAAPGIRSRADLETLIAFFEARHGQLYGFRFRDPVDHASGDPVSASDQALGTGDGATDTFQLTKHYADTGGTYARPIRKPVAGSVIIAVDGVVQADGVEVSVDPATGMVSFTTPPASGAAVTAGFAFDVPVRFDTDRLDISLEAMAAGEVAELPLIEIKD